MKKIILGLFIISSSLLFAQQHFFYGFQADYGPFSRNFDYNRDILKSKNIGRMFNIGASMSYRMFDCLTLEAGTRLNGNRWKIQDLNFKERNTGYEALMVTNNRFVSFYGSLKYSYDLGRKKYFYFRAGYEHSAIGQKQLSASKQFQVGSDFVKMDFNYGKSNQAITPEIGYEFFNASGNLITLGLKYHKKFSGDDFLRGEYSVVNQNNLNVKDGITLTGSYLAFTFQMNGLLHYIPKKEKIKKEKKITPKDTIKQKPILVDTTPGKPVDTTKAVVLNDKLAYDREYAITNKVKVTSKKVKISVWDHQIEDGDRINLILNDAWVLTDYTLRNNKYTFEVELKEGENKLILYALNLGKYKPNTAAIMVDDGVKKQEVVLESTLDESSALEINFTKK